MGNVDEIFLVFETKFKNVKDDLGKYIEKNLQEMILAGFDKAGIPHGNLYNSIKVKYDTSTNKVQLGMLVYGYFVNYGVLNFTGAGGAKEVDTSLWGIHASQGSQFRFKRQGLKPRKTGGYGITPKPFLPTKDQINQMIELFINEYKKLK